MSPTVIIDANKSTMFFGKNQNLKTLFEYIQKSGMLKIQTGGTTLLGEYKKTSSILQILSAFEQAGLVNSVRNETVDAEEGELKNNEDCRSNDLHIIALARTSRARILVSDDRLLGLDFNDPGLVSAPRGFVYKDDEHFAPMKKRFKL